MGTEFDFFDPKSHTESDAVTPAQHRNRLLLRDFMSRAGFQNLAEEWWHYTLRDEPYPNDYFDREVQ
jgi:D-alanyl-D-alanine dipeptidase